MAVVTPLNNPGGPEGDTVTVDEQLLNTEYWVPAPNYFGNVRVVQGAPEFQMNQPPFEDMPRFQTNQPPFEAMPLFQTNQPPFEDMPRFNM